MARCGALHDDLRRCRLPEGHDGEHVAMKPRGTTLRNVRIDEQRWEAFKEACADEGTDASKQIRDMIDVWLDALGRHEGIPADSFLYPKK